MKKLLFLIPILFYSCLVSPESVETKSLDSINTEQGKIKYIVSTEERASFIFSDGAGNFLQTNIYNNFEIQLDVTTAFEFYYSLKGSGRTEINIYLDGELVHTEICAVQICEMTDKKRFDKL